MQTKHPLEIILENLLLAIPARGAVKATEREAAKAALEEWRKLPQPEADTELTDLRALKEAVRKALTWGPPQAEPLPSREQAFRDYSLPSGTPRMVQAQAVQSSNPPPPQNWKRAEPVKPATAAQTLASGVVQAARVMPAQG
jgi:hypothetical protein